MDADRNASLADGVDHVIPDVIALRHMTSEQLLDLGRHEVAYLRGGSQRGSPVLVLVGADGVPVVRVESLEAAARAAAYLSLELVKVH